MSRIMTVFGAKSVFCGEGCRDAFRADRMHRLIYPPWEVDGKLINHTEASLRLQFCAYCGERATTLTGDTK